VKLEVDNAPASGVIELGFDRNGDGKFEEAELARFRGDRKHQIFFNKAGPAGELVFRTAVQDWGAALDAAETYNRRLLRLRLYRPLKEGEKPGNEGGVEKLPGGGSVEVLPVLDSGKPVRVEGEEVVKTRAITQTVTLDAYPPENVEFLDFPRKLARGAPLPLRARGEDPESGIRRVVFFAGKPGKDGGAPPDAVQAPGKPDAARKTWSAALPVTTDQKGKVEVSVQFTNGAGQSTTKTVIIQLVDPPPAGAAAAAKAGTRIEGTVSQGKRPQPGVTVSLRVGPQGAVLDTTVTNAKGQYAFVNVPPGTYRVTAAKTADATRGETTVLVVAGKDKKDADVQLRR
jgi:hypothetical protein